MIDLHLHLDGSIPVDTARRLAAAQGIPVPETREELKKEMSVVHDCKNLNDYLARFQLACSLLHVREAGIPLIVHAGEAAGAESVREAVMNGAVRIGHGVRSLEDPEVVQLLVDKKVMLELCPTSNLQTGIFPSYEAYPIRQLMDAGVRVCVNTDNMTVSDTTLAKEWDHLIEAAQLSQEEVHAILLDTVEATFAPDKIKEQLRKAVP